METILNVTELFAKELQAQHNIKCIVTIDEKEVNERIGTMAAKDTTIIYLEEFVTGSFIQHRASIDYEQNICVCFARLADLNATAMERFILREDIMENIVKPYIRKLQARFDNNIKKYNFSYSGGRWDDNEVQIILRFTLPQTLPMC